MRKTINSIKYSILATALLIFPQLAFSNTPLQQSIFDVMNYSEVIKMTLELDVEAVTENIRSDEKHQAVLSFTNKDGEELSWNTKVSLRGKFRRMKCNGILPLKINFKKKELKKAGLATFDDLKLVPHCVEDPAMAKEWLLKEYLAYKIYNEITDLSYRVQLVEITYKDAKTQDSDTQFAFLIEDTAQLRNRINAEKSQSKYGLTRDSFDTQQIKTMALFQYMIGNSDWDISSSRNIKVVQQDNELIAIPYDFDFSGLVNAGYATPNSSKNIRTVQERVYIGFEQDLEDQAATVQLFKDRKENIIESVKNFKLLKRQSRRDIVNYINSFYDNIDDIKTPGMLAEIIEKELEKERDLR